jgi:membrane associated rhomboid family serine protease
MSLNNSNNPNQPNPAASNENPVLSFYQQWRERTPFVTRTLMITILVCYILSWFLISDQLLGNIPYFTIFQFEIYRLILSPIVGNSILDVIIVALFFPQMGAQLESSYGSGFFLTLNVILTLVINVTYITICIILYFLGMPEIIFYSCSGFWTIIFALMTIQCMQVLVVDDAK